jgi:NAD+ diphosphatase
MSNLTKNAPIFVFQNRCLVIPDGLSLTDAASAGLDRGLFTRAFGAGLQFIPAISGNGEGWYACALPDKQTLPAGWTGVSLRSCIAALGLTAACGLLRAWHLVQWLRDSQYCGTCGAKNGFRDPPEYARRCPVCGRVEFPRISPAVITLIEGTGKYGGRVLLAHNARFETCVYSLIAGFVEAGESLEMAAAREIREEVGIEVSDIRYCTSQPWPFPNSLMLGFRARWKAGEIRVDGEEIERAAWFERDALPALPGDGSIARRLLDEWVEEGAHSTRTSTTGTLR